jgi:hypothetical protein
MRTGVVLCVNTETEIALEIFYGKIRSVSNKQTELFDNVCYVEFQVICLTERLLNDICFYHKLFPGSSQPSILTLSVTVNVVLLF